jgi:hypothetical protein
MSQQDEQIYNVITGCDLLHQQEHMAAGNNKFWGKFPGDIYRAAVQH